jgi:D-3-phosphoglycerate dehydrogenase / 2-oxoglutarate reductase
MIHNIIFNFDSTIIDTPGIELLVQNALLKIPEKDRPDIVARLDGYTNQAILGTLPLSEAFKKRLELVPVTETEVKAVCENIIRFINPSVRETISALLKHGKNIFIFSTSVDQIVDPVVDELHIPRNNVYTNRFKYGDDGHILGFDEGNPLFMNSGKVYIAEQLQKEGRLSGGTAVVGNSKSDLSIKSNNISEMFVYFASSHVQNEIRRQADFQVDRFDQLLPLFCSDDELPHEKAGPFTESDTGIDAKPYIILLEEIHEKAKRKLADAGYEIHAERGAWETESLCTNAVKANVLGIRSRTKITAQAIKCMPSLWTIGAFCIGTNQIDLQAAAEAGIPVFNAPYSNTRSVAELVVGETIMLFRRIFEKSNAAHQGQWLKSSSGCNEIRGKTIGIIGYGRIGSQVSVLLEHMGMSVIFHDIVDKLPLGNAKRAADLAQLLQHSDIVTLHVPDTPETRGMIGATELALMKKGAFLLNSSRGKVVDLDALRKAIEGKQIGGAAIDVFPSEPVLPEDVFNSPLQHLHNVILTPHIGGSTIEAQENIGDYVSSKIDKFLTTGSTIGAVNFPEVELPRVNSTHRILHVHMNVPGVLAKVNSVFARRNINVEGQILQTKGSIGYLIVDVNQDISEQVLSLMKPITETIKLRRIV